LRCPRPGATSWVWTQKEEGIVPHVTGSKIAVGDRKPGGGE